MNLICSVITLEQRSCQGVPVPFNPYRVTELGKKKFFFLSYFVVLDA